MRKAFVGLLLSMMYMMTFASSCPLGMGEVPAFPPYSNQTYCMMTKEAVLHDLTGTRTWEYVTQAQATAQCAAAFPQGDLPVNALWQAALRWAENVDDNWTGGAVGQGEFKTDLWIPNGNGGWNKFYEMGDGHWEFVVGVGPEHDEVTAGFIYQLAGGDPRTWSTNGLGGNARFHFGPIDTYGPGAQLGVTTNRASSYIMRGGDDSEPGAFGVAINHAGNAAQDVGFRCVCPKAACGRP